MYVVCDEEVHSHTYASCNNISCIILWTNFSNLIMEVLVREPVHFFANQLM